MSEVIEPIELSPQSSLDYLLNQLQYANAIVNATPLDACQAYTDVMKQAGELTKILPSNYLSTLRDVQIIAGENLVQACLSMTPPEDIETIKPILSGRLHRLNNLLNLGFYLCEHRLSIELNGEIYTPARCAALASEQAPESTMVEQLQLRAAQTFIAVD